MYFNEQPKQRESSILYNRHIIASMIMQYVIIDHLDGRNSLEEGSSELIIEKVD